MDSLPFMWLVSCTFDSSIRIPTVTKNDFLLGSRRRGALPLAPALCPLGTVVLSKERRGWTAQQGMGRGPRVPRSLPGLGRRRLTSQGCLGTLRLN